MPNRKSQGKPRRRKRLLGLSHGMWVGLALLLLIGSAVVCIVYGVWASTFDLTQVDNIPERSAIYDMDGRFYARLSGEDRVVVHLEDVSDYFVKALLAREDSRFFSHHGIDPVGIARAMMTNLAHGHIRQGGSTLTQQLALNTFLGGEHTRSINRKLIEAFLALRIEQNFTKKQIIESYMNRIYFGAGVYGVETASEAYYHKHAKDLSLTQSAMLVALIRSPNRYSPFKNLRRAITQRDEVLDRMAELKMITPAECDAAKRDTLALAKKPPRTEDNYAMDAIKREVDTLLNNDQMDQGGLRVYTTIDPILQKAAQIAVDAQLRKVEERPGYRHPTRVQFAGQTLDADSATPYLQGALVMVDNRSGGIRALVGGRDYDESHFNRALFAKRQMGSTFKPFVYAAAFARGLQPTAPIDDGPIRNGELRTVSNWHPENSDGTYHGEMPAAEGLIQSRNTMSVRVGDYAGIENVQRVAGVVGLGEIPSQPSIYLGAFEESLRDVTAAYSVFPNEGVRKQAYIVERIDDADGQMLYRAAHVTVPALSSRLSDEMTSVMEEVIEHGTAAGARALGWTRPAAGKTGTTNDYKDAWFVGYTRSLTCGVWVGFDHPQTIQARGYGAALALPIWVEAMNAASPQRYPATDLGGGWRQQPEAGTTVTRDFESLPSNIFRSFQRFLTGH
ncbi:MAG: PBP1A family penicillin-binding protein [Chthoniobacteraceae bacterium]